MRSSVFYQWGDDHDQIYKEKDYRKATDFCKQCQFCIITTPNAIFIKFAIKPTRIIQR